MRWTCGNPLTAISAYFGDARTVLCYEDGVSKWAINEVEIVALLFVGEQECRRELGKAVAALFRAPEAQSPNRRGVE